MPSSVPEVLFLQTPPTLTLEEGDAAANAFAVFSNAPSGNVAIALSSDEAAPGNSLILDSISLPALGLSTPSPGDLRGREDALAQGNRTFNVTVTASTPTALTTPSVTIAVTVLDDDTAYAVQGTGSGPEGNSGNRTATFTVTRSGDLRSSTTVEFTLGGTAIAGTDYLAAGGTAGTITFAPTETERTVTVEIVGDTQVEADETITLTLNHPTAKDSALLLTPTATITIANDDVTPAPTPPLPTPTPTPAPVPQLRGTADDSGTATGIVVPDGAPEPLPLAALGGQAATQTVRIANSGDGPLTIAAPQLRTIGSLPPGIDPANVFEVFLPSDRVAPGGSGELVIRLRGDLPPGDYRSILTVQTNVPGMEVYNFTVAGQVTLPRAVDVAPAIAAKLMEPLPETGGDDRIFGGAGNQWINGSFGDDLINGNGGQDVLTGGPGADSLYGGRGDDFLRGGAGDDWLSGDLGSDTLLGGQGADRFAIGAEDGGDFILDYEPGVDRFLLKAPLTADQVQLTALGNSTQIFAGDRLMATVVGIPATLLSAADFSPIA